MKSVLIRIIAFVGCACALAAAQSTQSVNTSAPLPSADVAAIDALRTDLVDAFNKNDVPRLLSHVTPDVVVTWQNGEICQGPDQLKSFIDRMMTGPDRVVESVNAEPVVTDRHIYGDFCVSWGLMHDTFSLTDGETLNFNSHFTATLARDGDTWKLASMHLSVNAFDNAILRTATIKIAERAGGAGALVGIVIGALAASLIARKKRVVKT